MDDLDDDERRSFDGSVLVTALALIIFELCILALCWAFR